MSLPTTYLFPTSTSLHYHLSSSSSFLYYYFPQDPNHNISYSPPPPSLSLEMYSDVDYGRLLPSSDGGFMAATAMSAAASSSLYPSSLMQEVNINGVHHDVSAMDKAAIASRNHREAEKRRRERIKSHLDTLRHILACDLKIDKATLLAKAVECVRELKNQTSRLPNISDFPTEANSITVQKMYSPSTKTTSNRLIMKATFCCDDRPNLLPELTDTFRSLHLRIFRAELATVGGRVRGVLVVVKDEEREEGEGLVEGEEEVFEEALKGVMERKVEGGGERMKKRRVVDREEYVDDNDGGSRGDLFLGG